MTQGLARHSAGTVLASPESRGIHEGLFNGTDPVSWFSRVSAWLLADAYPDLPIYSDALPKPITQDDPGHLFGVLFSGDWTRADGTSRILVELGVGLGLAQTSNPGVFDTADRPVVDMIRERLTQSAEPTPWPHLHYYLAHQSGLTGALANLYLLDLRAAEQTRTGGAPVRQSST